MHGVRGDIEGTMRLPTVLDLAAAEGFLAAVLQQVQADKALRLDASGVETLTLPCVQIILSAARNYDVTVSAPSNAFSSAFKDLGLDCPYDPEHVEGQGPGQGPVQVQAPDQVEGPLPQTRAVGPEADRADDAAFRLKGKRRPRRDEHTAGGGRCAEPRGRRQPAQDDAHAPIDRRRAVLEVERRREVDA